MKRFGICLQTFSMKYDNESLCTINNENKNERKIIFEKFKTDL